MTFGHSKDHRPDLKQLVWILTVSADGSVPMAYRLADGNTSDDPTHIPTWDALVKVLGRRDFLYVADSKLCSGQAMRHIDGAGGRFVTVLPRTRGEDKWFRDRIQANQPSWAEAIRLPGERTGDLDRVWSTFPSPLPSAEGYRVIWVHSTIKAARDEHARRGRIEAGAAAIDELTTRLAGPKTRLKTRAAIEQAIAKALADTGSARWLQSPSPRVSKRASGRSSVAGPAPTPGTGAPPAPGTPSAGNPATTPSPMTPPLTAASR